MDFATLRDNVRSIAAQFADNRRERQARRHLEKSDFDLLREAGLHLVGLPASEGGIWQSVQASGRSICESLRTLAAGDSSVALVCAMHPAVLSYWLTAPDKLSEDPLWQKQTQEILQSVKAGHWWGTITSEPGSGGDIIRSQTSAAPRDEQLSYFITGQKHFGSGSGVMSYMVTTALPEGEDEPDWFFVDMRDVPWDGSRGVRLIAEWDGHGMAATQSHGMAFERFPATRMAWQHNLLTVAANAGGFIGCLFTSVIVGIIDEALRVATEQLRARGLGAYEQTQWTRAQMEHWLIQQALDGMYQAIEGADDPRREVLQGKTAIAELSETVLTRLFRVIGGGTMSRRSPFGHWLADVRALGFLRPPWPLAFKTLAATDPTRS
jgi:alkylation response protein AidB-like acyl-CoA dehydrogenase